MKQKILERYILDALGKVRLKPHRKVSAVLAETMPEIIAELRRMATTPDSDIPTRKFAITMLEGFWRTLLTTSQSETRTAVRRLQTAVRARRAKVAETQTALKVHQVRADADKKLAAIGGA